MWADAVALYGLDSPDEDLARIEKVTVADVNRVARQYLDLDHAVTAVMVPRGSGDRWPSSGGFGGQESIALGEAKPTALPDWAQAALKRLAVPDSTTHPVVTHAAQRPDADRAARGRQRYRQRLRPHPQPAGGRRRPRISEGVSQLLDLLLPYGSERLDRVAFEQALDAIGARERAGVRILACRC